MDKDSRNMGNRGRGQIRDARGGIPGRGYGAAREGCGYGIYIMDNGSHVRLHFDSPEELAGFIRFLEDVGKLWKLWGHEGDGK